MSLNPCAVVAAAALLCAARVGATALAAAVPTISVTETAMNAPAVEAPAITLSLSARSSRIDSPAMPRFMISAAVAGDDQSIRVPGILSASSAAGSAGNFVAREGSGPAAPSPAAENSDRTLDRPAKESSVSFSVPSYTATLVEQETVAACLVLEAASQGEFGMRAVMAVIRNRARGMPELFAPTVLRAKQFSAFNRVTAGLESLAAAIGRARGDRMWSVALRIVDRAMDNSWSDPTDGATHYTRTGERTRWTRSLAKTTTIGVHSFYR